ncbi:hypothetical protein, partial [Bradyrhizobium sp. NAS80.1]|uniref:hypothetical protein n=1 Tax=Bradyrhizobium sp. NAS80.1 TaxID=1680159 RepID=UPI001AEF75D5
FREWTSNLLLVIPGRAQREPGIHTPSALGPWAIRADQICQARLLWFFRECGKPQAPTWLWIPGLALRAIPE